MKLEGGAIRLAVGGSASIPARDLDLKGTASLIVGDAPKAPPAFELPFVVQGRWDDPIMLPDTQSLIRRSGAAAPLLDAVRDRKTRDTVRSAIDRLDRRRRPPARRSPPRRPPPRTAADARRNRCYHRRSDESGAGRASGGEAGCSRAFRTLVKVAVASLIVGTILAHFGITADQILKDFGVTPERLAETGAPGLRLGAAEPAARRAGDRAGVVRGLPVPAAGRAAASKLHSLRARAAPRLALPRLVSSDAATSPTATTAIMIVQIALISGFTPSRTSE